MTEDSENALRNFLELFLGMYVEHFPPRVAELAVSVAICDMKTRPHVAYPLLDQLWDRVAFNPPTPLSRGGSWKTSKDPKMFIYWARLCQAHREEVAAKRFTACAAEQGVPLSLIHI